MTEAKNAPLFDLAGKRVYVAGHTGMVGAALMRRLGAESCTILTVDRAELDLTRQAETEQWIGTAKPDAVILAAAKVGGIAYNDRYPVAFLADNLAIALNVIRASYAAGVQKLLFLGSSCIYPKLAPQPMDEGMLLTGSLEPTNQWYAVAKIAGIKLVEAFRQQYGADFISVMPTNLYGPGDNYHPEHSHVPAALIRRLHETKLAGAPTVTVWGTGRPRREFLAVDDLADACVFVLKHYSGSKFLNVGTGQDITIAEFAQLVADVVGYRGRFVFDTSRPDGAPQKLLNVSELTRLGWRAKTPLQEGIAAAYSDLFSKELLAENGPVPNLVGSVGWTSPTSRSSAVGPIPYVSGFQAGFTASKRLDPLVVFLSGSYFSAAEVAGVQFNPADVVVGRIGASLAISPATAITAGFNVAYLTDTHSADLVLPNSDRLLSSVDVGFNTLLWNRTMLSITTQFGITGHTPDFRVITALPIRF